MVIQKEERTIFGKIYDFFHAIINIIVIFFTSIFGLKYTKPEKYETYASIRQNLEKSSRAEEARDPNQKIKGEIRKDRIPFRLGRTGRGFGRLARGIGRFFR